MQQVVHVGVHVQDCVLICVLLDVVDAHLVLGLAVQVVQQHVELLVVIVQLLVQGAVVEVVQKHAVVIVLDSAMVIVQQLVAVDAALAAQAVEIVVTVYARWIVATVVPDANQIVVADVQDAQLSAALTVKVDVETSALVHVQVVAMEAADKIVREDVLQVVLVDVKQELKQVHRVQELHVKVSVKAIVQVDALVVRLIVAVIVKVDVQLNAQVDVAAVVPVDVPVSVVAVVPVVVVRAAKLIAEVVLVAL